MKCESKDPDRYLDLPIQKQKNITLDFISILYNLARIKNKTRHI